jgi:hypothetical protein
MPPGDGIRRNILSVDATERDLLRDALIELNQRFFPGSNADPVPGGVSWWFKQDEIHQATHVHGGPEFLPWHREIVNRFEELLRQINPDLSLHYWNFADDPDPLFVDTFMGGKNGAAGEPWLSAGFYDPQAGQAGHPPDRDVTQDPFDPPSDISRDLTAGPLLPIPDLSLGSGFGLVCPEMPIADDDDITSATTYLEFRTRLECVHNFAHGHIGGTLGNPHISFRDPIVFLLHSNVDRIFARWQTDPAHPERLNEATVYGSETSIDVDVQGEIQNLTDDNVEPWSTGHGVFHNIRPWYAPDNQGVIHNYRDITIVPPPCYDTNLSTFHIDEVQNPFNAITNRFQIIFNDVPEEETTWRAAVVRVYTCPDTTVRVKPGSEMVAPFTVVVGSVVAQQGAHPHAYQDVKLWFSFTAGDLNSAPQSIGPVNTIIEVVGVEEFQFELRANTIDRETVAVQLALDQSGSMADPAGTSGLTRLAVLKDAANLFADTIQVNNGLGIIRFDQDAYPPNDPTYGGMPITRIMSDSDRDTAHTAIGLHGAFGNTSVGDGLKMAHDQLAALDPIDYVHHALLLLTDGIENEPDSIATVVGMGILDDRTFAIGLGNEFQVNTAALTAVSGSLGGNLLLSGTLTPDTDDFFRVKKFFLQILANVTNTSIVRDPTGYINVGTRIRIPFQLSEADINCRVILLTDFPVVKLSVETPDGQIIDEGNAAAFGVTFKAGDNLRTASFNLPLAFQANDMQSGTWYAILEIDEVILKRILASGDNKTHGNAMQGLLTHGARYCLTVHSFSNLRMEAALSQTGFTPGSTLSLRASLNEYNQPVNHRATVRAELEYPDQSHTTLPFTEIGPGRFETSLVANATGIYRFNIMADGGTYKGVPFTREQLLTAAVFNELPPDRNGGGRGDDSGIGTFEKCCRRMGLFVGLIVLLLMIIIILLYLRF